MPVDIPTPKMVAPGSESQQGADKCRTERLGLPDQTISPKAEFSANLCFVLLVHRTPRETQSSHSRRQSADWPCLVRCADWEAPQANRTGQVPQLQERLVQCKRTNDPTQCSCGQFSCTQPAQSICVNRFREPVPVGRSRTRHART